MLTASQFFWGEDKTKTKTHFKSVFLGLLWLILNMDVVPECKVLGHLSVFKPFHKFIQ